ncbi:unnamed protein product [Miscanthus lutarioriparius]|uniref:Uncharacterized protein n=1 Tax=Miscanthus lutarioriparius TaxID=422564 RepID=A0A811SF93_9POAL|nr:unnamed protein product [Miscanthus lutarioriparius]
MAEGLVPRIIVLALGAGTLGFPDALRVLLDIAGRRSPLTDIAICIFAMAVVTAQALGAMLLSRFVRKARAGGDAPPPRTDRFAQVTLVVSLVVAFLVSACLLVASGAGGLGLLHLVADVARKSPVIAALATGARPLLRVVLEEDHSQSHGAAAASRSTGAGRFGNMTQVASFTGVAAVVGTMLLARFTRKARNAAGAGGRGAAPASAADTRRVDGKLTRLAPYQAVVAFGLLCCLVLTTDAPLESGPDGAKYP